MMTTGPLPPSHRAVLIGVPLVLGVLEIGHPALLPAENIFETLAPISTWWTILHVLQIPLFASMGLAVWLLVRDLDGRPAQISRGAIAVFIVVYPAFDAAVGVSSGVIVHTTGSLDPAQRGAVEAGLQALFWGPVTGTMAIVGSVSWVVALVAAAWAWRRAGAPLYVVGALALSGVLLGVSHIRPLGPLACLFFLIGAGWVALRGGEPPPHAAAGT
jgi:hypothetical protein